MKAVEVRFIFNFLSNLKLNKLSKETRVAVLKNYTLLHTKVKEYDDKIEELRKKIFTDEDLQALQNAIINKQSISKELSEKNSEFNEVLGSILSEDCELNLEKLTEEDFIEALSVSDIDFTPADISNIKSIFN